MMLDVPSSVKSNPQQNFTKWYDRSPIIIDNSPLSFSSWTTFRNYPYHWNCLKYIDILSLQVSPVPFPPNHDKRLLNRTRCHGWKATTTSPTTQVDGIGWSAVTWSSNLGKTTIFCRELNKVFFHVFCWFIVFVGGFWRENQVILPKVWCFFWKFLLLHITWAPLIEQ